GSAYIFQYDGEGWYQQTKLTASDGASYDSFGYSVAIDGDRAIIGAYEDDDNGQESGSAYIFVRTEGWSQEAKLTAADGAANDSFGSSVALQGEIALIGAYGNGDDEANDLWDIGAAYLFEHSQNGWQQQIKLTASDGASNDNYGRSVALSMDGAIVGIPYDDDQGSSSGSAYIFDLAEGQSDAAVGQEAVETFIAHIISNSPTPLGGTTILTASLTTANNVTYTWSLGDGSPPFTISEVAGSSSVTHTYPAAGDYPVAVTATWSIDGDDSVVTGSTTVVVKPIVLEVTNNSPAPLGQTTTLTASAMITSLLFFEDFETLEDFGDGFGYYDDQGESVYTWLMDDWNWNLIGPGQDGDCLAPPPYNDSIVAFFGDEWDCNYGWDDSDYLEIANPITLPNTGEVILSFDSFEELDCNDDGGSEDDGSLDTFKTIGLASPAVKPNLQGCDITDRLLVEIATNNGTELTWTLLAEMDRDGDGWYTQNLSLADYRGQEIKLRFYFETDSEQHYTRGWMIDNVMIKSVIPTPAVGGMIYTWDFGDDTLVVNDGFVVTHNYATGGAYPVVVTASNVAISGLTATTTVFVDEPIIGLAIVDDGPTAFSQATTFTATVTQGNNLTYTWDFGDGLSLTGGPVVTNTYLYPKAYTVTLSAANSTGIETANTSIIVSESLAGLTVDINDSPIMAGETVILTASARLTSVLFFEDFETVENLGEGFGYYSGEDDVYTWFMNDEGWNLDCPSPAPNNSTVAHFGDSNNCNYAAWANSDYLEMAESVTLPASGAPMLSFSSYEDLDCTQSGGDESSINKDKAVGLASPLNQSCTIYDGLEVQIGTYNGRYWSWVTLTEMDNNGSGWHRQNLSLTDYLGQEIKIRFYFYSNYDPHNALGWMIDNVAITTLVPAATIEAELTYNWDFGDGTIELDSGASVAHTYQTEDIYTAVVTASNPVSLLTQTTYLRIVDPIELAVSKTGPEIVASGQPFTYTLTVTNTGQDLATNLLVTDTIPSGLNYLSGGIQSEDEVSWTVPWLAGQASVELSFVAMATDTVINSNYAVVAAGDKVPSSKLTAHDKAFNDYFGHSVAIDGQQAIVGAYRDDERGYTDSGSAYIFSRNDSGWFEEDKLVANDEVAFDYFGYSVAISGDWAIVGAYQDDDKGTSSGSVYLFERGQDGWQQKTKLTAGDGTSYDYFGYSVALSGDRAIVGAYGHNTGAAYIFVHDQTGWHEKAKLVPDDGAYNNFGYSVAIDGDQAIIGAYTEDDRGYDAGAAYIFSRDESGWQQEIKLTADDGVTSDYFGYSVAMSGDGVIVGAYQDDQGADEDTGSAYIFSRDETGWQQEAKLVANDSTAYGYFGYSVAMSGDRAIVGAYENDGEDEDSGAAYIYTRDLNGWGQPVKLAAGDGASNDNFGYSVAASGYATIIGARWDDVNTGAAYVFGPRRGQGASTVGEDVVVTYIFDVTTGSPTALGQATTLTSTLTAANSVTYTWAFGDGE
ncbi:MAG: PKD domain-containing protein, partial [Chloroflexi bacterium]|nr:PKD domain-containing protein [Chloroflexota bacterium]